MGTPVDFGGTRKQAEADGLLGGSGTFKAKEGDNRVRLMSECLPYQNDYKGEKSFKWLCYVLDRRDGGIKAYFMPHTVYKAIEALQANPDYAFAEVPMPYDLTIRAVKAGTKDVEYSVIPARKELPLTDDEEQAYHKVKHISEVKAALREKQAGNTPQTSGQPEPPPPTDHDDLNWTPF